MVLAARAARGNVASLQITAEQLKAARPTAVNLAWAVDRMLAEILQAPPGDWVALAADNARKIHRQDVAACRAMGREGARKVPEVATILTHCNAGALATGGYGSALGVIRAAIEAGKKVRVLADETRPVLQGARLTAWELKRDGIDVEVIADNSASWLMQRRQVDLVVVGADRIAANGDVANKIGTYQVAVSARFHEVPFYVAAPWSTVDLACREGSLIPIEERAAREVTHWGDAALTPAGAAVRNPAFDVTPSNLVNAIFTERGTIEPVERATIAGLSTGQHELAALD
jgi:methylthioribose-1-phosphate isomerase